MEIIEEQKTTFNSCKFFKEIYTKLNSPKIETIYLKGNRNSESISFHLKKQDYFIYSGEIKHFLDCNVYEWLLDHEIETSLRDIEVIKKCLKKNLKRLEISDDSFKYIILDENGNETTIEFKQMDLSENETILKANEIENTLEFEEEFKIDFEKLVIELFIDNENKLSESGEKLLEIPLDKLLCIISNNEKYKIKFSNPDSIGKRFLKISDYNENLKFNQYLASI